MLPLTLKSKAFDINNNFTITLDGPAASGKGTIGKRLAEKFKLVYCQSSIVYRSLALSCLNQKIDPTDVKAVTELSQTVKYLENTGLNTEEISIVASQIAVIPEVRTNLGKYLIKLIEITPRIIMEGRDIGTVIAPFADLKIFITADVNIRAQRRYQELLTEGKACDLAEVLSQLQIRDQRDTERNTAPLSIPNGALEIDTSYLSPEEVIDKIIKFIEIS
ncbi:MAG: (d)CMP kinase [Rickettsia endosymbiont of Bryobia graminum]|nr:(d)CMP kinase [Rickettsia endosymbiont of Bryobia graminum]